MTCLNKENWIKSARTYSFRSETAMRDGHIIVPANLPDKNDARPASAFRANSAELSCEIPPSALVDGDRALGMISIRRGIVIEAYHDCRCAVRKL